MSIDWGRLESSALELGLDVVGAAQAGPTPAWMTYRTWLDAGYSGDMSYLGRDDAVARRENPRTLLPEVRSLLVVGVSYAGPPLPTLPPLHGRVARYAWEGDYHVWLLSRLEALVAVLAENSGQQFPFRCYVDTGPVIERAWAVAAGLGWIGKNGCLIHPRLGSYLLLGVALLGIDLPERPRPELPTCGSCRRCIDACPTRAIIEPGMVDARRCLSYLTIELRGPIPEGLRPALGDRVFGCDVCQEVCPWNARPMLHWSSTLAPSSSVLELPPLLELDADAFRTRFRHTSLWRAGIAGLARNAAVVMGNLGDTRIRDRLYRTVANHREPMVREHAAWALERLG